ncbi:MAG: nucleotide-binding universal stress UspA family protein [Saprospiraceae bacterium]|jgi:nucleotide-binding universal stress UspA family protein
MQNTTEIKVLGTGNSKHEMVTSVLNEYLHKAGLSIPVNDYTDVDLFIKDGIESVPAVIYQGQVFSIGNNENFNKSLRKVVTAVLKDADFGQMEKIVIPVDFSHVSTNAFAYGHRLGTDLGAITKAVHVFLPSATELTEAATVNIDFAMLRESYLEDFVATFDLDWGNDLMRVSLIDSEFRTGFPGDQILDSIEDNAAYLTVMGSTGQSSFLRKWFGSVSTKIMNESPSPVLIVPEEACYKGINRIAYAYEDIEQDEAVLGKLASFANRFGAEIHLIHVENDAKPDPGYYITEVLNKYYPSSLISTSSIKSDNIPKGITDYCVARYIDLICLSTHKKGFLEQLYDDNISQQIAIISSLPLLILKNDE